MGGANEMISRFWSRSRRWSKLRAACWTLNRARSSQRQTNESECEFLFWTTNQLIYSEDPLQRWFPGFEVEEAFFGKAWMWKLMEGCLLELIRARSLQSSAMNTWEWMQRSNKFGLSEANKWEWMWRSNNFVWFRRDSSGGKDLQKSVCNLFLTSECHTYMWKDQNCIKKTLPLELNTETWNWNPFSSKWAKGLLETEN